MKSIKFLFSSLLCFLLINVNLLSYSSAAQAGDVYWPDDDWDVATPEAQQMNSTTLTEMYDFIKQYNLNFHSVLITRNGYIIDENYLYNAEITGEQKFNTTSSYMIRKNGSLHILYSCTKSVISLLIGIAIEKGYITSVNETIYNIFPDKWIYGDSKKNINIEDLLTIRSGLQWDEGFDAFSNWWIYNISLDYVLKKPLVSLPGTDFEYSSGNVQLLSAVIQNKTGMKTSEFAHANLFSPIGIKAEEWEWDEIDWEWGTGALDKISFGGWGLFMSPRAMARLGILSLNIGNWNGTQIVNENWISTSTKNHVGSPQYGYLFWLKNNEYYYAAGYMGQRLIVIPEYGIVIVLFSEIFDIDYATELMINDYILKAIIPSSNRQISGFNSIFFVMVVSISTVLIIKKRKVKNFSVSSSM